MSRGKRSGAPGEIDAIKAFIVIMAALTFVLGIYTLFFVKPQVTDLDKVNRQAKADCLQIQRLCAKNGSLLDAYGKAKDSGGIASPEEYFARMRDVSGIAKFSSLRTRRKTGGSRAYEEYYSDIAFNGGSWEQLVRFMFNVETGPKYRILEFDARRAKDKGNDDAWKVNMKAARRTQPETE